MPNSGFKFITITRTPGYEQMVSNSSKFDSTSELVLDARARGRYPLFLLPSPTLTHPYQGSSALTLSLALASHQDISLTPFRFHSISSSPKTRTLCLEKPTRPSKPVLRSSKSSKRLQVRKRLRRSWMVRGRWWRVVAVG